MRYILYPIGYMFMAAALLAILGFVVMLSGALFHRYAGFSANEALIAGFATFIVLAGGMAGLIEAAHGESP